MAEDYPEERKELSEYNEASFQILRLHNNWEQCNLLSSQGRLMELNWKLDVIWKELSTDAARMNKDFYFKEIEKINNEIAISKRLINKARLYQALIKKEIFLRKLQDDAGKGSRRSVADDSPL